MGYFKRFFGHLKTVLTHKRWVFYYASRLGYPWLGLFHDMSKFSPVEFFEGVKYWTGNRSPIVAAKEKNGMSYAWFHHRGRNKHHYEYWIDKLDQGGVPCMIPFQYVIEMICDWLAACRSYENVKDEVFLREYEWWCDKAQTAKIHNDTKLLITKILWNLASQQRYCGGNEKRALRDISLRLAFWEKMYYDKNIEKLWKED